ncbi:aspartate aminotransferase [Xylariaceae sp. FL0255]|nr:aspartate aminotransferase [Xylariaceae sp. FL0255]
MGSLPLCEHPFDGIAEPQLESLNALQAAYAADTNPNKVNLMIGAYQDDDGKSFVLPSVKKARQRLFDNADWNHEYPPSHLGTQQYRDLSSALFFGEDSPLVQNGCIAAMQCLGASGACHMGALFLKKHYKTPGNRGANNTKVYIPEETWANHPNVFHHVGFETESLPWYNTKTQLLDIDALLARIATLPSRSIIVLQVAGNNPTGCDPSPSDWEALAQAFISGHHFAFLDAAYPGFVSGSLEEDCLPVRVFADAGIPLILATTYGKAFGLYGERAGILFITLDSKITAKRAEGQMKLLARAETGAQPAFGAAIVEMILANRELRCIWQEDLKLMAGELMSRRLALYKALKKRGGKKDWSFMMGQTGMFTYTGLKAEQIVRLREEHHVYIQDTGRLSIAGLCSSNIDLVAAGLWAVVQQD